MLEAMQEHKVTVAGQDVPPEAAVPGAGHAEPGRAGRDLSAARGAARPLHVPDRVGLPSEAEEIEIARTTTGDALPALDHLLDGERDHRHQSLVRRVPVPDHIYAYAAQLVRRTRPKDPTAPAWLKPLVAWGAGPRAVQNLILGAKARAALWAATWCGWKTCRKWLCPCSRIA